MTRLQADLLLLFATLIWGTAFIAQKDAFAHVGPCTFVAARFGLSALLVLPLAARERGRAALEAAGGKALSLIGLFFAAGVLFQQAGVGFTSTANAGFFTGLYALFVPVICLVGFGQKLPARVFPAALVCVSGVWLLTGGSLTSLAHMGRGDVLVLLCAAAFAAQIVMVGRIMARVAAPFQLCFFQYASAALAAALCAAVGEQPSLHGLGAALGPILYAGVLSGGIAFTIQVVAQQHTPASDSAVIMSAEAVFAALAGALMKNEFLTPPALAGCALILGAILLVELGAAVKKQA